MSNSPSLFDLGRLHNTGRLESLSFFHEMGIVKFSM